MKTFKRLLHGVSDAVQFARDGGIMAWVSNHFALRNSDDDDFARLKIDKAVENEDAVRLDQLKMLISDNSPKGSLNKLVFCLNKDGSNISNFTNSMLKPGTIIESITVQIVEEFDGVLQDEASIAIGDEDILLEAFQEMFSEDAVDALQEYESFFILRDTLDVNLNLGFSEGTKGAALIHIRYVAPVYYSLLPESSLVFIPERKVVHIDFKGSEGETATMYIKDTATKCGIVDGVFVFDIDNVTGKKHVFGTDPEEVYTFDYNEETYQIINMTKEIGNG